jgi:hypothetical protein
MTADSRPQPHSYALTIRFIQGYRYLDLCGEALINLESQLGGYWIPGEMSPSRGVMKNDVLGMTAGFSSEALQVTQSEYFDFPEFLASASTIYETLWKTFRVAAVNAPSFRAAYQRGFDAVEDAEHYVQSLKLCELSKSVGASLQGAIAGTSFAFVTNRDIEWASMQVSERRRLEVKSIRQERRQTIDDRLLVRTKLLPKNQHDALQGLLKMRSKQPSYSPAAAQFDWEQCYESVFDTSTFQLAKFLEESHKWTVAATANLTGGTP